MAKGIQHEPSAHATRRLAHVTQQKWGAQLVLITHFAAEIMLIAFLNPLMPELNASCSGYLPECFLGFLNFNACS
jgi:hypothetical protein